MVVSAALDTAEGEPRRTLLLAGLGAAARGNDAAGFASLTAHWARSGGESNDKRGVSLIARLEQSGRVELARVLARAEIERHRSAEALFALASLVERDAREDRSAGLWSESAKLAIGTPLQARAHRAALRHAPSERADEAEAAIAGGDVRDVLRLAPAALTSARLYARVRTLDRLAEIATDESSQAAVLRIALTYADLRGAALGALERDRLIVIATRCHASPNVALTLSGRAPSSIDEAAARDALMGHAPRTELPDRAAMVALRALASVMAEDSSGSLLLSALVAHPPSPAGWTAVLAGLSRASTRSAASRCIDRWVPLGVAPPRGFSVLATALERAEADTLAESAWLQAIRANEKGARQRLGAALEVRARAAYESGDRATAKSLLERSLAIDPDEERS